MSWARHAWHERPVRVLLAAGGILALLYLLLRPTGDLQTVLANLAFLLTSGWAGALCLRTWRQLGRVGLPWLFFGCGCLTWFAGQVFWSLFHLLAGRQVGYPSLADAGYLGLYPFFFAGLVTVIHRGMDRFPTRELLLDTGILIVLSGALLYHFLLQPLLERQDQSSLALATSLAWQGGTFGLVFLTIIALICGSDLLGRGPLSTLLVGLVAFTAGNVIYGRLALGNDYYAGHPVDLAWQEGFVFVGIAAIVAARADRLPVPWSMPEARRSSLVRAVIVAVVVLAVIWLRAFTELRDRSNPDIAIAVGITGALLALRLGLATLQAERLDSRTRERDRMAGVVAASAAIGSLIEVDDLLPPLASAAARAVGRQRAEVYLFDEDGTRVQAAQFFGFTEHERAMTQGWEHLPVGSIPAEARMLALRRAVVQRLDSDEVPLNELETMRRIGRLQALVTPLLAHDRVIGAIYLWTPGDERPFEQADLDAAAAIGQQVGLALHNARLLTHSRQYAAEQAALLRVSQAAISNLELRTVLSEIAQASLGIANAESCAIEIWRPELDDTIMAAQAYHSDWSGPINVGRSYPLGYWDSTRRVLQTGETLNILATDPQLNAHEQATFAAAGTKAILVIPLRLGDENLGVLTLFSREPSHFTPDGVRVGQELAAQVSLAIDRARLHAALEARANTDGLTGVLNHRAILESLDHELARTRRSHSPLSVLMIDLDGFKQVNDTHGHQTGDEVLRATALLLRESLRSIDYVGRYGGDEFLVLLPETSREDARQVVARLLNIAAAQPYHVGGLRLPISLSIGIATVPEDGETRADLLAAADTRMYANKAAQR